VLIDAVKARELATREIARVAAEWGLDDLVLIPDMTEEVAEGWVFFWDSEKHLTTGDDRYALGGGGPIFIARKDGSWRWSGQAKAGRPRSLGTAPAARFSRGERALPPSD
jgi:hypothetical protein